MPELNISVFRCFVGKIYFIRSQKKYTQLVYRGYIYNKKTTQLNGNSTWRCLDLSKTRCKAIVRTQNGRLIGVREKHHHGPHTDRLNNRMLYRTEDECYAQKNALHFKAEKRQTFDSVAFDIEEINLYGSLYETEEEEDKNNELN